MRPTKTEGTDIMEVMEVTTMLGSRMVYRLDICTIVYVTTKPSFEGKILGFFPLDYPSTGSGTGTLCD